MKIVSHPDIFETARSQIASTLHQHLRRGETVLWLLAGGSAITLEVAIMNQLRDASTENLLISLSDERYGPVGHADENWQQLLDAGFNSAHATVYRPLSGVDASPTATKFAAQLEAWANHADYRFGLFGIGTDGHTSGILPHSTAVTATESVTVYTGPDYTRLTTTAAFLSRLDEAVIYATGEAKHATLQKLITTNTSHQEQPAQVLKGIKKSTLYTDMPL